jgi:hypothetical protein
MYRNYAFRPEGVSIDAFPRRPNAMQMESIEESFATMDMVGEACQIQVENVLNRLYSIHDYSNMSYDTMASTMYYELGNLAMCIEANTPRPQLPIQTGLFRMDSFDM